MEIRISVTVGAGIQLYAVRPQQTAQGEGGTASWNDITGKPSTFPPSSHTHLISEVTALQSALDGKAATSHTHTVNQITGLEDQLAEKADLVGGFIPTSQIPAQAITEFLGDVANQAAMLALTGQRGDWCIRTDQNRTYFLIADDASQLSNWRYIETPASPVTSVNGQVGVIVLGKGDVGLGNVNNTSDADKPVSTAQAAALAGKSNTGHTHTIGDIEDFEDNVLSLKILGMEATPNEPITVGDSILSALGRLQAQINAAIGIRPASQLDIHSDVSANFTFSNMPNSESNIAQGNNTRGILRFDATQCTQVRLVIGVVTGSTSANDPRCYPQYFDGANWITVGAGTVASGDAVSIANNGTGLVTNWITLPSGAKSDVRWRCASNGGDGAADPVFGNIALQFR